MGVHAFLFPHKHLQGQGAALKTPEQNSGPWDGESFA